jgi:hypothetical protein
MDDDPEFAAAIRNAIRPAKERLEESVYDRAFKDPILAMFILKKLDPEYNDKVQAARAFAQAMQDDPARLALAEFGAALRERREAMARQEIASLIEVKALPAAGTTTQNTSKAGS